MHDRDFGAVSEAGVGYPGVQRALVDGRSYNYRAGLQVGAIGIYVDLGDLLAIIPIRIIMLTGLRVR